MIKKILDLIEKKLNEKSRYEGYISNGDLSFEYISDEELDKYLIKSEELGYLRITVIPHYGDTRSLIKIIGITERGHKFKNESFLSKIKELFNIDRNIVIVGTIVIPIIIAVLTFLVTK